MNLCPIGVLRSAGLPFSWVGELRDDEAASAIDAADDVRAAQIASMAVERADAVMREVACRPLFALAVDTMNPTLYENALRPYAQGARKRGRPRGRALGALLQRFATKNDTAAGFGPLDRALLGGDTPLHQPRTSAGVWAARRGFLSWWVVQALADAVVADEEGAGAWRLHSLAVAENGALRLGERRFALSLPDEQLLAAVRADAMGGMSRELRESRLVRSGLLRRTLLVPPSQSDPAAWLLGVLDVDHPRLRWWREQIQRLAGAADAIALGGPGSRATALRTLQQELETLTGHEMAPRGAGQFYADRQVLYEEARSAAEPFGVGGELQSGVTCDVAAVASLAARYGYARHRQARAWLWERLGAASAPLTDVAAAVAGEPADLLAAEETGDAAIIRQRLAMLARTGAGRVDPERLAGALDGLPQPELSFSSPDLMLDTAVPGLPRRVLGEHHEGLQAFGHVQLFCDEEPLHAWLREALPVPLETLAQIVAPRSQGKAFLQELPEALSLEFGAAALCPPAAPFGSARVVRQGDQPVIELPGHAPATLLPLDLDNPLYRVLSPHGAVLPSLCAGTHTPEIRLGEAVLQRERWVVPVPEVAGDAAQRFVAARRLRRFHGLPEEVFVRVASQAKPFYVDFRIPVLTDVLWHWARHAPDMVISPMLPGGDGLWLRRGADAYCSELRLSAVLTADERGG